MEHLPKWITFRAINCVPILLSSTWWVSTVRVWKGNGRLAKDHTKLSCQGHFWKRIRVGVMDGWMGELMDGRVDEWKVGWMDEWMDGWISGWMDGWMSGGMEG